MGSRQPTRRYLDRCARAPKRQQEMAGITVVGSCRGCPRRDRCELRLHRHRGATESRYSAAENRRALFRGESAPASIAALVPGRTPLFGEPHAAPEA